MFEKIGNFFNKMMKPEIKELASKDAAKERLHLVLMQDRANVSVDFLELMKQEIIDVIKKYIVVDENAIDVRLTNQENSDGTNGAPSLYANIPIINIKNEVKAEKIKDGTLLYENLESEKTEVEELVLEPIELPEKVEDLTSQGVGESSENNTEFSEIIDELDTKIGNNISVQENLPENEIIIEEVKEAEQGSVEPVLDFVNDDIDDEEEDDDVTFDDLLKKAEEEEAINSSKKSEENKKVKKNNKPKKR